MITLIGLHDPADLAPRLRARILGCDLLVGGARHLAAFPEARATRLLIDRQIDTLLEQIAAAVAAGAQVVVLASGDPLWYGIGATLRRRFPPALLEIVPAPSAAQLAFAALAEPWHDALLLSAHGRPLEPVLTRLLAEPGRAAILTDPQHPPDLIAQRLLERGFPDGPAAVCEDLGLPTQRVTRAPLSAIAAQRWGPLNVLVLLPEAVPAAPPFGLDDDEVEHDGLITHLEVRAVAVALLRLRPDSICWDIGAGSGAVALEAARIAWRGAVYAVERNAARLARLRRNLARWQGARVHAVHGVAPAACQAWPDPDAVFLGGGGAELPRLIDACAARLRPGGRLVLTLVTLERLGPALERLRARGWPVSIRQIAVSRSRPLAGQTYLAALNPVLILAASRPVEDV